MTICIAVICDEGEKVIATSDRMITISLPPIEYEYGIPKIQELSKTCIALTAGSALAHTDLCKEVTSIVSSLSAPTIKEIAEKTVESYISQRKKKIEEEILKARGFTYDTFYPNLRNLPPEIGITIDSRIEDYDFNLEILLAGVDKDGAHIYQIDNPGTMNCFDSISYGAIGSGWHHSVYSLIEDGYTNRVPLKLAAFLIYKAKKRAESAPGVGKDSDMWIISANGVTTVKEQTIKKLEEIYEKKLEIERSRTKEIDDLINKLQF